MWSKEEVIASVRKHLRAKGYKVSTATDLYIRPTDMVWCIHFISDTLLVKKKEAKAFLQKEVLKGIKLLDKPKMIDKSVPYGYVTPTSMAEQTGIPRETIMSAIYTDRIYAKKFNRQWIIPSEEATAFAINRRRAGKR